MSDQTDAAPKQISAPFTAEQVAMLREYQQDDYVHPFTCCDHQTMTVETDGFHCPKCGRVQTWCWLWMADGSFKKFYRPKLAATVLLPPSEWEKKAKVLARRLEEADAESEEYEAALKDIARLRSELEAAKAENVRLRENWKIKAEQFLGDMRHAQAAAAEREKQLVAALKPFLEVPWEWDNLRPSDWKRGWVLIEDIDRAQAALDAAKGGDVHAAP